MLDYQLNFRKKKERQRQTGRMHSRGALYGVLSVFAVPGNVGTNSLGGRYYSIKKDKYCNGAFTGHSLN